jgi:large subunit ribosomal protein L21
MFAVIRTSGRQYRVAANDVIEINRVAVDIGDRIDFADVLMVGGPDGSKFGGPLLEGATVSGEVIDHPRGPKVIAFKKRRRHNYKRKKGHRQDLTLVRITDILTDGQKPAPRKAAARKTEKAEQAAEASAEPTVSFPAATGPADDLKQLTGVGPVIERKLNAIGITTFAQIAALTPDEIEKVDEALHSKGRVEREGWIAEAAALAKGEQPKPKE